MGGPSLPSAPPKSLFHVEVKFSVPSSVFHGSPWLLLSRAWSCVVTQAEKSSGPGGDVWAPRAWRAVPWAPCPRVSGEGACEELSPGSVASCCSCPMPAALGTSAAPCRVARGGRADASCTVDPFWRSLIVCVIYFKGRVTESERERSSLLKLSPQLATSPPGPVPAAPSGFPAGVVAAACCLPPAGSLLGSRTGTPDSVL